MSRFTDLEGAVRYLAERVLGENLDIAALAARDTPQDMPLAAEPVPAADLDPILARLAALESRGSPMPAPIDLTPFDERLRTLEQRPDPDLMTAIEALAARIQRMEQVKVAPPQPQDDSAEKQRRAHMEQQLTQIIVAFNDLSGQVAALKTAFEHHSHELDWRSDPTGPVMMAMGRS